MTNKQKQFEALWNVGEREKALNLWGGVVSSFYDFTKQEIKEIRETILEVDVKIFEPRYKSHIKTYFEEDRKVLVDLVNEWANTFRSYSLIIK